MDTGRTDLMLLLLLVVDAGLMERAERAGASLVLRRGLEGPEVGPNARGPARADLTTSPLPAFLFFCNRASSFFNLHRSWTSATKRRVVEMHTCLLRNHCGKIKGGNAEKPLWQRWQNQRWQNQR